MPIQNRTGLLEVYLLERKVGELHYSSHHNEMQFAYDSAYLASEDVIPLSYALPLQHEPFDSDRTTAFFENLLPPDQVRRKLGPVLRISRHNIFGFLEALGGDCAGAIALWPRGGRPNDAPERLKELDEEESAQILASLKKRPLFVNGVDGYRISGAGAQSKLIARIVDGRIVLPLFGAPSTHIIKPSVEDYPDTVYNELFSMRLAERVGLSVAPCGVMEIRGNAYYWTQRYDREVVDGRIRRLHQEDFCQILGVPGERKYESEGGPTFAECMAALADMNVSLADRFSFIDRLAFNYLIGNADAHGKNSSLLYRGSGGKKLAPLYDVMSTEIYEHLSRVAAMSIGGATRIDDVTRESFASAAREVGMRPQLVLGRLDALSHKVLSAAGDLAAELSVKWPSAVYAKIQDVIRHHVEHVRM